MGENDWMCRLIAVSKMAFRGKELISTIAGMLGAHLLPIMPGGHWRTCKQHFACHLVHDRGTRGWRIAISSSWRRVNHSRWKHNILLTERGLNMADLKKSGRQTSLSDAGWTRQGHLKPILKR